MGQKNMVWMIRVLLLMEVKKEQITYWFLHKSIEVERQMVMVNNDNSLILNQHEWNDQYGIKYERLVPVLVNAIKELSAEVEQLKSQLNN